jgi:RNA polymerase sigma-70 factor (ECF subfamily)
MRQAAASGTSDSDARELSQLRRAARGEAEALRGLYERYAPIVFAVGLRILANRNESEEVVQDTFLEVWRRAGEYDPRRGSPIAWVITIARTRAIDRLRARASQERMLVKTDSSPPPSASPADLNEDRELRERVQAALVGLPAEQRRVLELAYFEGLSQSEIAKKTGEALGTVKTRVRLGMEKLSAILAEVWKVDRT